VLPRTNPKPSLNLPRNPPSELPRSPIVHRHNNHATQSAAKKRRNPLRAILPPQHHPLAVANSPRLQFPAKPKRHLQNLPVREPLHAVATPLPISALIAMRPKIRQEKL
jgi:hypothetical protein